MICTVKSGPLEYQCIVRPNRSLSWREAGTVYAVIATVILAIGVGCYLLGLKLVLPFSGLEIVTLGTGFYLCLARGENREMVSINTDWVVVERGRSRPMQRYELQRYWVRVVMERPADTWYPSRLTLRSHGKEIEVGAFLDEEDRQRLARELSHALHNPLRLPCGDS